MSFVSSVKIEIEFSFVIQSVEFPTLNLRAEWLYHSGRQFQF
jgi:hypothetical protein